ncbi:TPA: XkdX family protein [Staphylococcus aureus]|nr:XkdX family protein [Staphylococcus aureus]HEB2163311.1 XkdX family protein [Staphylococcus aureus]HEB2187541.1 XkdX family protein [Staphylococcus aureus]HEB2199916.1 XkdX family protein [Staphylococcus aureus]HEB2208073.1 XkdX family protein [Staphylococcus aureus]
MLKLISPTFEDIKTWYQWKEYTKEDIAWFVDMEVIDKEEYAIITGEKYPETKDEKSQV